MVRASDQRYRGRGFDSYRQLRKCVISSSLCIVHNGFFQVGQDRKVLPNDRSHSKSIRIITRDELDCYFYDLPLILKSSYAGLKERQMLNPFRPPLDKVAKAVVSVAFCGRRRNSSLNPHL